MSESGIAPARRFSIRRLLARFSLLLLCVVAVFYIVFYFAQTGLVYQSDRNVFRDPAALGWKFERVSVPVGADTTTGWFMPVDGARGIVLFCHGNGSNIAGHLESTRLFRELRFSVLMFDYGGYGESTGSPSEQRVYDDGLAMWKWLVVGKKYSPDRIVIWGTSFGGAAACDLASKVTPAAVVLESTFTSMADAAFADYPWFPADWFLRSHFRSIHKAPRLRAPLLVIHSPDDTQYPIAHGRALFEAAPEPKRFVETRGDHYDTAISKARYVPEFESFLNSRLPAP